VRTGTRKVFWDDAAVAAILLAAVLLRGSRGVKPTLALRTVRPVPLPGHAQRFSAGLATGQPS
jgi:hypothetical protein